MPFPHKNEGGDVIEVIRDVVIERSVIPRSVAWQASRTALRYAFQADFLPFVETIRERNDSSRIVEVGVYSPLLYSNPEDTIICNNRERMRNASLVTAVKALHKAAGKDFVDADYTKIIVDLNGNSTGLHEDIGNYSRTFVQLAGARELSFIDTTATSFRKKFALDLLLPGDSYTMSFRKDPTSITHSAEYFGWPYSVGIYINNVNE